MKVFLPVATEQNLTIIPRFEETNVSVTIRSEQLDSEVTTSYTATTTNGYMIIPVTYDFKESESYEITVTDNSGTIIWRGKGFATAETNLQEYKMN